MITYLEGISVTTELPATDVHSSIGTVGVSHYRKTNDDYNS